MGAAAAGGAATAAYAHGRGPMSPYAARNQQYPNQPYPNQPPGNQGYGQPLSPSNPAYNMGNMGNQGYNQYGYNQGRGDQMLNPPNDYNANRMSDGYGLDQPYDQPSGDPRAATAAAAGLTGAAGAALAAGAANRGSPSPGPHGYGQPPHARAASPGYAEMPAEPKPFGEALDNQNQAQNSGQYAEMAAEPRGSDQVHAAFAEMPAEGKPHTSPSDTNQNNTHFFEMATDQVAPVELDSGYVAPIQASHDAQTKDQQPTSQSPTAQSPQGHGMQRRGTGDAPYDPYSQQRQGTADRTSPEGHGMKRRGTGDNPGAGSPAPYGMDPRMRPSPSPITPGAGPRSPGPQSPRSPRSPGPRSPGPRNSPGPRRPAPRGDQPFAPSPLSTPVPQNESGYSRPAYNQQPYSSSPRGAQRGPDHNVPVSRPTQQTAFAEPQPQSPITNNAGFDFTSGFSRPQDSFDRRPSESREPASREGYPGYKPYTQQPQGGWNGV